MSCVLISIFRVSSTILRSIKSQTYRSKYITTLGCSIVHPKYCFVLKLSRKRLLNTNALSENCKIYKDSEIDHIWLDGICVAITSQQTSDDETVCIVRLLGKTLNTLGHFCIPNIIALPSFGSQRWGPRTFLERRNPLILAIFFGRVRFSRACVFALE